MLVGRARVERSKGHTPTSYWTYCTIHRHVLSHIAITISFLIQGAKKLTTMSTHPLMQLVFVALTMLTLLVSSNGQLPHLLRGATKSELVAIIDEQDNRGRSLVVYKPMTLVSAEENSVTVKLRQALFGDDTKCGPNANDPEDVALLTFAIYRKPGGAVDNCDVHLKKDACWSTDIVVACDPETKQATVDIYTRDVYHLDKFKDRVDNPMVPHQYGMCIGPLSTVSDTVLQTAVFDCDSNRGDNRGFDCESDENCPAGQWCSEVFDDFPRRACKDFVAPGQDCGWNNFIPPGTEGQCDPQAAACVDYTSCTGLIGPPGQCVAYEGDCSSGQGCGPDSYCNAWLGQCMAQRRETQCCDNDAPCRTGFVCTENPAGPAGPFSFFTCQEGVIDDGSCNSDTNCPSSQWCLLEFEGAFPGICADYAGVGQECNGVGVVPPRPESRCEPGAAICVEYTACFDMFSDPLGRCVALEGECSSPQDCGPSSYCNFQAGGQCTAGGLEGDCCDIANAPCQRPYECFESFSPFGSSSTCVRFR
jgi:hypothetical protein